MKVIGLTGGIASGKSTVSNYLKSKDIPVIDADQIAREIVNIGQPALEEICLNFGSKILNADRSLNRKALGEIVFSNDKLLKKLNEITHPRIISRIINRIELYRESKKNSIVFVDAALLIEMNMRQLVDEVWLVKVDKETQRRRLMDRDGFSFAEAENRINAQMSMEEKVNFADVVIDNNNGIDYLYTQIQKRLDGLTGNFSEG
ncbi:dephospho-CoA kinase [Geosporobacter ferrireducens]|uniref:Dephospho-CoA kinase n=1 Tax=Geosporobacter ferrireducens TaxID=1424294 RepID=A0A1D8GPC3_9FIRM|nr:dephospho-CoA kinase [Geosporobacter ferrireducens]AOT72728.1 dephospho-CoA kinase [Geosporobacter ferrireducens]MTI55139.1 dephospho-CoA kinase [Geosporobacter ferrireducens]